MKHSAMLMLLLSGLLWGITSHADSTKLNDSNTMLVYKSPSCGCCGDWADHMISNGFSVQIHHPKNLDAIKQTLGVSPRYHACHTSIQAGYFFEGHIPATVIGHFLKQKPKDVVGLAVPGMPMGSPGMDVPGQYRPYQVLIVHKDGSSTPYARVSNDEIVYLGASQ